MKIIIITDDEKNIIYLRAKIREKKKTFLVTRNAILIKYKSSPSSNVTILYYYYLARPGTGKKTDIYDDDVTTSYSIRLLKLLLKTFEVVVYAKRQMPQQRFRDFRRHSLNIRFSVKMLIL